MQGEDSMPIYQCSTAAGMLTSAMRAEIAAAITDAHVEATGAPRVFVQVLTDANCAQAVEHHRRPETNNRKGPGR
jgi:phenylpyruvate tautomerase PptA (4-oxalocrotonate tautomerase family)